MQDELNAMEVGPEFDIVTNTATMLTLVFFAMIYASGLPILIPVACITFICYFGFYKTLVLRFYKKPPRVGAGIIEAVIGLLPYAAILRLMFSAWMLGNTDILPATFPVLSASASGVSQADSGSYNSNSYLDFLGKAQEHLPANPNSASLVERLSQPNIFPLAVVIVFIIVVKIILKLWPYLPVAWVQNIFGCMYKMCCKHSAKVYVDSSGHVLNSVEGYDLLKDNGNGLRQEMAPFTGDYFSYISRKDEMPSKCLDMCSSAFSTDLNTITEEEAINGFVRLDKDDKYVVKSKQWLHSSTHLGISRTKGELKKTYEVIRDIGVNSYHLKNIPRYRLAWYSLTEGALNVDEYHQNKRAKLKEKKKDKPKPKGNKKGNKVYPGDGDEEGSEGDEKELDYDEFAKAEHRSNEYGEAALVAGEAQLVDDDTYGGDVEMAAKLYQQ
jgi:hypothetical protein